MNSPQLRFVLLFFVVVHLHLTNNRVPVVYLPQTPFWFSNRVHQTVLQLVVWPSNMSPNNQRVPQPGWSSDSICQELRSTVYQLGRVCSVCPGHFCGRYSDTSVDRRRRTTLDNQITVCRFIHHTTTHVQIHFLEICLGLSRTEG